MLIAHQFDTEKHIYRVPEEYVLATSDVLEMNGCYDDLRMAPPSKLEQAGMRGTATHLAIMAHETKCDWDDAVRGFESVNDVKVMAEVEINMAAYFRFRKHYSIELVCPMERTMVYRHAGTDALIGATPDAVCLVNGEFTILDFKTCFKQYGMKQKQLKLTWSMQLQSYLEAIEADDELWTQISRPDCIHKAVLHLHPECGKERGFKPWGFEFHPFPSDGQFLWDSMIRVTQAKLAYGYRLDRDTPKTQEVPLVYGNGNYEKPSDTEF